jgi:hypothetical protein
LAVLRDTPKETDQRILSEAASTIVLLKQRQTAYLAIAAIVSLTIGLIIWTNNPQQLSVENQEQDTQASQILTMESLKCAFYQGGMEALEEQLDEAVDVIGLPSPTFIEESLKHF